MSSATPVVAPTPLVKSSSLDALGPKAPSPRPSPRPEDLPNPVKPTEQQYEQTADASCAVRGCGAGRRGDSSAAQQRRRRTVTAHERRCRRALEQPSGAVASGRSATAATLNFHCVSVSLLIRFRLNQVCDEWKQNIKVVLFGEDQIQRKVR